jgi:hypothetical protein
MYKRAKYNCIGRYYTVSFLLPDGAESSEAGMLV